MVKCVANTKLYHVFEFFVPVIGVCTVYNSIQTILHIKELVKVHCNWVLKIIIHSGNGNSYTIHFVELNTIQLIEQNLNQNLTLNLRKKRYLNALFLLATYGI
jgi:hypothetical protein